MAYFFIIGAIVLRLLPHPPNFAPIAALALFGGTYLDKKFAIIIPLAALFISDIFFKGTYEIWVMIAVYGCFVIAGLIGIWLKKHKKIQFVIAGTLTSSILFFLITNFAVWAATPWYTNNVSGLLQCYTLAIPFFRNTLAGDLFYVGILFGAYELVRYLVKQKRVQEIKI